MLYGARFRLIFANRGLYWHGFSEEEIGRFYGEILGGDAQTPRGLEPKDERGKYLTYIHYLLLQLQFESDLMNSVDNLSGSSFNWL